MSKYPRIGEQGRVPQKNDKSGRIGLKQRKCCLCDNMATHYTDIQYSYMRGEDGVFPLCTDHYLLPGKNLKHFLKQIEISGFDSA